jgi:hypothetical protein
MSINFSLQADFEPKALDDLPVGDLFDQIDFEAIADHWLAAFTAIGGVSDGRSRIKSMIPRR